MNLKSQKGYSLIEIGVGLLILTVFLICSVAVFNGSYNHYRMIQQRNLAVDYAVSSMEELLQEDSDILTGFFSEVLDTNTNKYQLEINEEFRDYVCASTNTLESKFQERYDRLNLKAGSTLTIDEYIYQDKDFLINSYIQNEINNYTESDLNSKEVQSGNYGMLVSNVIETGNATLLDPVANSNSFVNGEMAIRKTILRLPLTDEKAYGNKVLKLKVEVLYTSKVNTANLKNEDVQVITLESVKIAD